MKEIKIKGVIENKESFYICDFLQYAVPEVIDENQNSCLLIDYMIMEEKLTVLDNETGAVLEMCKIAFESLICYDDKGRYEVINQNSFINPKDGLI